MDDFKFPEMAPVPVMVKDMTLRDYFAGLAMQVILKDQYEDGIYVGDSDNDSEYDCAESAYIVAYAMLKERGR